MIKVVFGGGGKKVALIDVGLLLGGQRKLLTRKDLGKAFVAITISPSQYLPSIDRSDEFGKTGIAKMLER